MASSGEAPLLSVFGGKITTFRKLAESVLEKIAPFFPKLGKPWTARASLPGGDFAYDEVDKLHCRTAAQVFVPQARRMLPRIFRAYGTNAEKMFDGARFAKDMGQVLRPPERAGNQLPHD